MGLRCYWLLFDKTHNIKTAMSWTITSGNGVYLPQIDLWCDARRKTERSFVSHAHSDHIAPHRTIICSRATSRLMKERLPSQRNEIVLEYDQPYEIEPETELRLYPAGHILGSSQLWLQRDGESLLFTGDFKIRAGRAAETCEAPRADVLIMETTFGLPRYEFPPEDQVFADVALFCRVAIAEMATPVLFCYSLGKSQEVIHRLGEEGLPLMLHAQTWKISRIYESLGLKLPAFHPFSAAEAKGHVIICPPQSRASAWMQEIGPVRTAVITGWALDRSAIYRYGCDAAFPVSDHAGYSDLLAFVERVQPRRVYTIHGFAREFASDLRRGGIEAWALGAENQLELSLN
jgi:Cft2 family RNA processing exonuclease